METPEVGDGHAPLYTDILIDEEQLQTRVEEIADEVIERWSDQNPLFVCLLRGAAPFTARLMTAIAKKAPHFHPEVDYMTIRTYGDEREPHPPEIVMDLAPTTDVTNRPVIVLDDVLDSGTSGEFLEATLGQRGAASVDLVVQAAKDRDRPFAPNVAIAGFVLPNVWLTGSGLDDARLGPEANRWAPWVATAADLDPEA